MTVLTADQKRLAAQCAKMLSKFNDDMAALSLGISEISETLQQLANGEDIDFDRRFRQLTAASEALEGFDAGILQVAMAAAAGIFEQLTKE